MSTSKSCGCTHKKKNDLTGKIFGEYTVLKMLSNKKCICRCSCGVEKELYYSNLLNGSSTSCGHVRKQKNSIEGNKYGKLLVLKELGKGKVLCKCDCGNTKEIWKKTLKNGTVKSCGCTSTPYKDITGQQFGYWKVLKHIDGEQWECQCAACGKVKVQYRSHLINGETKSCGCKQGELLKASMLKYYGELSPLRLQNPREKWQVETLNNKDKLKEYIEGLGFKPTITDLCQRLDIQSSTMLIRVHNAGLDNLVEIQPMHSKYEDEIVNYIKSIYDKEVLTNTRSVIAPYELDIYIPEKQLAIEFNGNYWHSDMMLHDSKYHQNKTLKCIDKNVRLIHIFEYEWTNENAKTKLKSLLNNILDRCISIYARDTKCVIVDNQVVYDFENKNHLQSFAKSSINIGLEYNNEIISIMTFGNPRYDSSFQYEIIRYCNKLNTNIVGGAEKIFKHFLNIYKPESILTYTDLSKFSGLVYKKLGFSTTVKDITKPGYVWVNSDTGEVYSRYNTQKSKLVEKGLGTNDQTEDEIMSQLGYYKIYNSGNLRYKWYRKETL